jgi:NAD(P)H-hydrate epimerase
MKMVEAITTEEMFAIEENAEYLGISKTQLMECAGSAVAKEVFSRPKLGKNCVVFAGPGKNGGDGMVAARYLATKGFKVSVILVGQEEKIVDDNVKRNWEILRQLKATVDIYVASDSSLLPNVSTQIIIDALLGIGAKGKLLPPISEAVKKINELKAFRVAVDVPTGIDASTGEVLGEAVKAHLTVTFHKLKSGLLKAKNYVGELVVADVGIPKEAEIFAGPGDVLTVRKSRAPTSHKGDFGRVVVVGGSEVFVGAPALAGLSALQTGVDLVYVAAPQKAAYTISSYSPDLITIKLKGENLSKTDIPIIRPYVEKATAVIVGPGLGLKEETVEAVKSLLILIEKLNKPLVLDADGLKIFGRLKRNLKIEGVLTPHAGEFEIVTGEKPKSNIRERGDQVKEFAKRFNATILLKGNIDIISDGKKVKFNLTGNPGMTVGGTGDTLTGIVGGLLAQGATPFNASVAGAFINGAAGDLIYSKKGYHILPSDIIKKIPNIIEDPMSHVKVRRAVKFQ